MKAQEGLYMIRPSFKRREGNPGVRATPARGLPYLLFFFFFLHNVFTRQVGLPEC